MAQRAARLRDAVVDYREVGAPNGRAIALALRQVAWAVGDARVGRAARHATSVARAVGARWRHGYRLAACQQQRWQGPHHLAPTPL